MLATHPFARSRLSPIPPPPLREKELELEILPLRHLWGWKRFGLVLVVTIVIWAHGCHGEEDNDMGFIIGNTKRTKDKGQMSGLSSIHDPTACVAPSSEPESD
jgi:hypothetical protein